MPILLRKLNYRNILLDRERSGEGVGILRRDGEVGYFTWLGFIELDEAVLLEGAVPVKLAVVAYSLRDYMPADWVDLDKKTGEMIQGCFVGTGVYAVVKEGVPRIVRRTRKEGQHNF